jgi:hypothetical protein
MLVGGVVVDDQVQLPPRPRHGDPLEEGEELAVAVTRMALIEHPIRGHLQGGKQRRGAVSAVIVGAPLWPSGCYRSDRLRALQRLDRPFSSTQHDRVLGWVQIQPDHVTDLALKLGGRWRT